MQQGRALIVIAVCATIAGANTNEEIALFARTHRTWLARLVELPEDPRHTPSHDTFDRVLSALDSVAFQKCLLAWLNALTCASISSRRARLPLDAAAIPGARKARMPGVSSFDFSQVSQ